MQPVFGRRRTFYVIVLYRMAVQVVIEYSTQSGVRFPSSPTDGAVVAACMLLSHMTSYVTMFHVNYSDSRHL